MSSMAAQEPQQEKTSDNDKYQKLLSSYMGLSFSIFLGFLPQNSIPLLSDLQTKNRVLSRKLARAEEQLAQLLSRRKEDAKANARVVEIFASHRHSWQQEQKRLLLQIEECGDEIAFLKGKLEDFESVEADLKANNEDLKREVSERDEMLDFVNRSNFEVEGVSEECFACNGDEMGSVYTAATDNADGGFGSDFLNSVSGATSKLWSEKAASLWKDMQYESIESLYHMKHFVSRRESPWKVNGDSTGVSSKLKSLEQELLNLERLQKADLSKAPSQMRKQAKRYHELAGKIDDLCRRMQTSDPCETTTPNSEFRNQRQSEFLLEAFRLQQSASEANQKLTALQTETGNSYLGDEVENPGQLATRRSLGSIRNNFKEIQRNLEIWLARIIGDLEGLLARDGASRAREYYVSRYPLCSSNNGF